MTGKGEPQHSKSLQLSVKFCSLLLAASLSTVSHHHVRLSRLGSNPRQVKTPCTRYGFHDNSITFWCRITLFHRFGAKVKTSDTKRKRVKIKLQGNLTSYISKNLFLMHLSAKGFFWKTIIFPYFLVLIEAPEGAVQLNIRTPNNLPKSSASTVQILRNFRGEDGDLTFFRMENSWKLHQMKSDVPRPLVVSWYLVSTIPETDTPQTPETSTCAKLLEKAQGFCSQISLTKSDENFGSLHDFEAFHGSQKCCLLHFFKSDGRFQQDSSTFSPIHPFTNHS